MFIGIFGLLLAVAIIWPEALLPKQPPPPPNTNTKNPTGNG